MRFTPGLLLALASSVAAQRFTNSSTPVTELSTATGTETAIPSSSAGPPAPVDLADADLGPGASLTTLPDGSVAVLLSGIANGVATFSVGGGLPDGISLGDLIQILFSILVEALENNGKRAATDCQLEVTVDGQRVFIEDLETTDGLVGKSTNGAEAGAQDPVLKFNNICGDNPVALTVANVKVAADDGTGNGGGNGGGTDPIVTDSTLTNAEGEPTGTETLTFFPTNSEGAITNSEGETIIPTDTAATNSEGALTNSEGETVTATGTETAPIATATSPAGFPGSIGNFALFGCVGSNNGFPTFELSESSGSMDLDRCASNCDGRGYFGVRDTDCYCGDEIDSDNTSRVDIDQCDIECPGDDSEFCGGDAPLDRMNRFSRRQSAIPNTVLLTVYVSLGGSVTLTDILTATVTDQDTITTTFTTTISDASTTETKTVTAIYECYNGQCYPETGKGGRIVYVFKPYPGEECDGEYVYISEACDCKGGSQYVPHYCSNGSCNGKQVYKPEQCDDWYNYDVCYTPVDCESCEHGQVIYKPWENSYGTPEHPKMPEIPACSHPECPAIEHESKPTPPCVGDHCEDSGSKGGNNGGSDSGSKGETPCVGDHCGSSDSGSKGETPCVGDHCEETGSKGSNNGGSGNNGGSSDSGSKGETPCVGDHCTTEGSGSKGQNNGGSSDSGSKGEAPCSGDHCEPTIVNGAGKQAVSGLAFLAAVAAALL
ncbi:uncharacterized protein FIESC28_10092 [Fusarium coffeatum]|uniref:WSC domain-containing protein n=1 Tax=Fusarium coffeatum TaxID=231269 RepID=A0A366QW14_9HYPO|nr:uncharacterized protein FIESC28_10092 [Fusarium coffeatum]RBR08912.1 hypothetical protein FIESC28_10092 [Fusarium coffeatum]